MFQKYAKVLSDLLERSLIHGSDIAWSDGEEQEGYWVKKSVMEMAKKEGETFWLSIDQLAEDYQELIDVKKLSAAVPGNMRFNR